MKIYLSLLVGIFYAFGSEAKDYKVVDNQPVHATISTKGVNRIATENDRIAEVIGNQNEFIMESDADRGEVFLTPHLQEGKKTKITLITEQGKHIELLLTITAEEPQVIQLQNQATAMTPEIAPPTPYASSYKGSMKEETLSKQEVFEILQSMHRSEKKGEPLRRLGCLSQHPSLALEQASYWRFGARTAIKADIQNRSKNTIKLQESDFKHCLGTVEAVAMEETELATKASTSVYVVGRDEIH